MDQQSKEKTNHTLSDIVGKLCGDLIGKTLDDNNHATGSTAIVMLCLAAMMFTVSVVSKIISVFLYVIITIYALYVVLPWFGYSLDLLFNIA